MDWLNDEAARLIKDKAERLSRCRGFTSSDLPDIAQKLRIHLWQQASTFDPSVASWETWVSFILDKRCISILRHRHAAKRSPDREECSLNDPVRDEDGRVVQRSETTPEATDDSFRVADLRHDLNALYEQLPKGLKQIFDLLGRGGTVRSMSIEIGVSRREIRRRWEELLRHFEDAGLRDYL